MEELVLLKLGGSLITDKKTAYTAKTDVLKRLAKEIKESVSKNIIVVHGSGSFGHYAAKHEKILEEHSIIGFCKVQDAASKLNRIVIKSFLEEEIAAISLQPSAITIGKNGRIENIDTAIIIEYIKRGMIPVCYGDIILDESRQSMIASGEEMMAAIAHKLKDIFEIKVIVAGIVDGVFEGNFKDNPYANLIEEIKYSDCDKIKGFLGMSEGIDVTGGMIHKVERLCEIAKEGIRCLIINGSKEGYLKKALDGEMIRGTIIK